MKFPMARVVLGSAALLILAACSRSPEPPAEATPPPAAAIGAWGFDLDGMDRTVKPGDDFFKFANGTWIASNTIPPDLSRWGAFTRLAVEAEAHVQEIIKTLPANPAPGSAEQKVHDFYESYIDVGAIDQLGLEPARPALNDIAAAKTHGDIARLMGRPDLGLDTPINPGVTIDEKNPDRYIVGIGQSGLNLPDRDYYLKDDPALKEIRTKYVAHVEKMLSLAGEAEPAKQAQAIFALETEIAKRHWPAAKRRERELTYNLRTRAELDTLARNYPWKDLLGAAGFDDQKEYVVA